MDGRLSSAQAAEIVVAAKADPSAEGLLLQAAERDTFWQLRNQCQSVAAAAVGDEEADERIRRSRYLRFRTSGGAIDVEARFPAADGAPLVAQVTSLGQELYEKARKSGRPEPKAAYLADALVLLLSEGSRAPKVTVNLHVDEAAFDRGHTVAGERCEISGVGPVTVATARALALKGSVKRLGRRDHDVTRVAHHGKDIPAKLRSAIEARDEVCVVPGCDMAVGLEIDHIVPREHGGLTCSENLCRLCKYHHWQKTHHGWIIAGPPGGWTWTPPPPGWKGTRRFNRN